MRRNTFGLLAIAGLMGLGAQEVPPTEAFDVAIAKPYTGAPSPDGYNHQITPEGITMRGVSMGYCIRLASSHAGPTSSYALSAFD